MLAGDERRAEPWALSVRARPSVQSTRSARDRRAALRLQQAGCAWMALSPATRTSWGDCNVGMPHLLD
jgi:hypothetical protein